MREKSREKGYTLLELTIVLAILDILMLAAVPHFQNLISSAKRAAALEEAQITADAVRLYILDRQEEGELKARDILPLINLELDQPGNILEDYMSLGQEDARIETVVVDIATGDLSQLTYRTPDCRVRLTWNSEGRLTVEYPQEGI